MGCTCENNKAEEDLEIKKQPKEIISYKLDKNSLQKLVKIQSHIRGNLYRKKNSIERLLIENQTNQNSFINNNNYDSDENIYTQLEEEQITESDINYLFNNYIPLKDGEEVQIKPLTQIENGALYYGEWDSKGNKHGRGIQLWPDGSKYSGYWINNKANKRGKLIHRDGDVYEGEWLDDKAEGYGIYSHIDGAKYEGFWKDDKQEGKGKEIWPDGNSYEGEYSGGNKQGKGKFIWSDGSIYEGDFMNNNIEGKGIYKWADNRIYNGNWKNNQMDGYGEFTWPDGRSYKGGYKNDKKEGYGIFKWPNGQEYRGSWKNGKQHGEGEIFNPKTNQCKKYIWENGKRIV